MIDITKDILSLTDFKRGSSKILKRMKRTRRPVILTINGKAELIVQTAEEYQKLIEQAGRTQTIEGIRRGLESMKNDRGRPAEEVFADMESKHAYLRRT